LAARADAFGAGEIAEFESRPASRSSASNFSSATSAACGVRSLPGEKTGTV
jgi:hypothetical protein